MDKPDRIAAFLPYLDETVQERLVTLEKVRVLAYRHSGPSGANPPWTGKDPV